MNTSVNKHNEKLSNFLEFLRQSIVKNDNDVRDLQAVTSKVNLFQSSDAFHIETSSFIRCANQMTSFYIKYITRNEMG